MAGFDLNLKHGTWVVVADGEKAMFLKNRGDARAPQMEVIREMAQENPPTREQGTERPGRHSDGPSPHNSAYEETDWHRLAKERFADEIADRLHEWARSGRFDEIVVVAPPPVLGEMRKRFHRDVAERIVAEIPRTLTNHSVAEIGALLNAA